MEAAQGNSSKGGGGCGIAQAYTHHTLRWGGEGLITQCINGSREHGDCHSRSTAVTETRVRNLQAPNPSNACGSGRNTVEYVDQTGFALLVAQDQQSARAGDTVSVARLRLGYCQLILASRPNARNRSTEAYCATCTAQVHHTDGCLEGSKRCRVGLSNARPAPVQGQRNRGETIGSGRG